MAGRAYPTAPTHARTRPPRQGLMLPMRAGDRVFLVIVAPRGQRAGVEVPRRPRPDRCCIVVRVNGVASRVSDLGASFWPAHYAAAFLAFADR